MHTLRYSPKSLTAAALLACITAPLAAQTPVRHASDIPPVAVFRSTDAAQRAAYMVPVTEGAAPTTTYRYAASAPAASGGPVVVESVPVTGLPGETVVVDRIPAGALPVAGGAPVTTYYAPLTYQVAAPQPVTAYSVPAPAAAYAAPPVGATVTYLPAVPPTYVNAMPATTLQPTTVYRPVTTYQPVTVYAPATTAVPVVAPAPPVVAVPAGPTVVARTKYYVQGQPVRNLFRAVTP